MPYTDINLPSIMFSQQIDGSTCRRVEGLIHYFEEMMKRQDKIIDLLTDIKDNTDRLEFL